jgi:hypothetical protein
MLDPINIPHIPSSHGTEILGPNNLTQTDATYCHCHRPSCVEAVANHDDVLEPRLQLLSSII